MSVTVAVGGWLAALAVAATWRVVLARRMELVARACHELRGPLTAARLAVQLAANASPAATPRGPLAAIDLELGRAGLALADLSAAQRGARAGDRIETFALAPLLADAVAAYRGRAWVKGLRLRLEAPPEGVLLRGDRLRIAQACGNLLANAIEHGDGTVRLRARASVHTVRIEVLDDGPGLPAPVAELVRRPRAGRGARGRGLAIAADVAARHGGRLAAAPCERGARLVLELPTPRPRP
ncbi:MAG TPA: HAMP domain-containing sensor histidine kinase [Conexibacter sp.]|jgi:signal transduction histidine kinase|nr:HAMP domain-containing sensor histidine kinase [Conexibacter sp.]